MNEITVTLPIETINACLAALVKLPYEQSQPHIDLLRTRATEAMASKQATTEVEPAND